MKHYYVTDSVASVATMEILEAFIESFAVIGHSGVRAHINFIGIFLSPLLNYNTYSKFAQR